MSFLSRLYKIAKSYTSSLKKADKVNQSYQNNGKPEFSSANEDEEPRPSEPNHFQNTEKNFFHLC